MPENNSGQTIVFIGLGSNLSDPHAQIDAAIQHLNAHPNIHFLRSSKRYESRPMGPDQPSFINAAAKIRTSLAPHALLKALLNIEQQQGRERNIPWGPRTLDLDLLLYGKQQIQSPDLIVPHPGIKDRDFVLVPLLDLDPNLKLPCGVHLNTLLQGLRERHIQPS